MIAGVVFTLYKVNLVLKSWFEDIALDWEKLSKDQYLVLEDVATPTNTRYAWICRTKAG
jgi:hypothetical protein